MAMLEDSKVATRLPAQDLQRARMFYADKLGLEPVDEQAEGLLYRCGGSEFALFKSARAPSGEHTQMVWEVEDVDAVVAELRDRGVAFEQYDFPGLTMADGIADVQGGWPSKGDKGLRVAWFKDSEGNLLSLGQHLP
jgi:catechol 2,3-dioxygenase-like lactoylglutathione lyase family enzyme